ncbi:Wzz/FepE/Etk N-terminal domain-containing protein [Neobacillus drentensis]|uniref:YveK family protein n=1 Tax=Neobacillus drentensis TaxID=220684 RepID=UPI001F3DC6CD|nr:Wzz/FepE/Etk N-terminal domain-containing protein [Neobacillus drentensis]ULT56214.1 Wzz/FepE/Etk N-terminal domain-containing protein [Neobacillus drentensis]
MEELDFITVKDLINAIKRRLWMIVIVTLLATIASGIYSFYFITPIYQSSTQILVNQSKENGQGIDYNQIQSNLELIETYSDIIKSPMILDIVSSKLELARPGKMLVGQINISSGEKSQVFTLTVQDKDPETAAKIANTIVETFNEEIPKLMNVNNVNVLSLAEVNQSPTNPSSKLIVVVGFIFGLIVSIGLCFLLEKIDDSIKTERDVEQYFGLPVLGDVFEIKGKHMKKRKHVNLAVRGESIDAQTK